MVVLLYKWKSPPVHYICMGASPKNKAEECNEVAGLKATTSQQTTIHNFFSVIELTRAL